MDSNLNRFVDAQANVYQTALREIKAGRKQSHWMWFIFPQIKGLGQSPTAQYFGVDGLPEARAYLACDLLRERLLEISEALLQIEHDDPAAIFGYPDTLKLQSSMTLFAWADPSCGIFQAVLDKFYHGQQDDATRRIVEG